MGKGTTALLGAGIGLVLFFAVNMVSILTLRGFRLDMTQEKLFTLSDGSKNIAAQVDEPIRLRFYFSRDQASDIPDLLSYGQRVTEMLEEYGHASDGMIEVEVVEPEPFSEEEASAVEDGLVGTSLGGLDKFYYGLVASNAVGDKELIPFFNPNEDRFLEYEITRIVRTLSNPERKVIGLMTSLPMEGAPFNPMTGQRGPARWKILDQIEGLFETRTIAMDVEEIPDDVEVLMVVHPKGLSESALYAIDQYVVGGGKALVMVDPFCQADTSGMDPSNPMASMSADRSSTLPKVFAAWGIELVKGRIAADRENALPMGGRYPGEESWPMVVWLGLREDNFDSDDAVTTALMQLNVPTPGILRALPEAGTTFTPLMFTSEDSMDMDVASIQFQQQPKELLASFVPRKESYTVAARVSGVVRTAFPNGKPAEEELFAPENGDGGEDGEEAAEPDDSLAGHLAESAGPVNVIVVADCDFLADGFWMQDYGIFGHRKIAGNADFVVNALENLGGGDDLISVRGRGEYARPFDRVEEIRREADEKYLNQEKLFEQEQSDTETRINELLRQEDGALIITPEIEAELADLYEKKADNIRKQRDALHERDRDIERLGFILKLLHIVVLPLVIAGAAVALGIVRYTKRKK